MKPYLLDHGRRYVKVGMSIITIWLPQKFRRICKIFFWEALMHTPRRQEIRRKIKEALGVSALYKDFIAALEVTKDSSALGPSQITYRLVKKLPQVSLQEVFQLLCDIWEGRLTPEEWKLR
jgi:hypothetical protein